MGHFSFSCMLTGLPITSGKPAVLIVMKLRDILFNNGENDLRKYGSTCLVSNDGTQVKFQPVWFPIYCDYDEYGGGENIRHDDNTKVLEDYYGLTIEQLVEIVTSGRKKDGFDDALKAIKDPKKKDKYGDPKYLERYKELITYSGMWVDGNVYEELTDKRRNDENDYINIGSPEILEALGFQEIEKDDKKERYNRQFKKDNLILHSDGTWIHIENEWVYSLYHLKKYCNKKGVDIDIEEMVKKDKVEQIYDYVVPKNKITFRKYQHNIFEILDAINEYKKLSDEEKETKEGIDYLLLIDSAQDSITETNMTRYIKYLFLNTDDYKLTISYFNAAKEGKLRDNLVRFWRFDYYMYCMGRYYDIIGTSPQDGEYDPVKKVLEIALKYCKR